MMSLVQVSNLSKNYGKLTAVEDFSFEVNKGEIYAFVGPDGAGKTTIMRSICGLLQAEKAKIIIDGYDLNKEHDKIKPLLGYMPQIFSLYPDLSIEENLTFYAGIFGIEGKEFELKSEKLYSFSNLKPFRKRRAQALSGGMKQKLALSCALIHDPKILILDEPTTGVDPLSRQQFWNILLNLKKEGVTIIVSTPYMDEVTRADRACFIFKGKKLAEDKPSLLPDLFEGKIYIADITPDAATLHSLESIQGIKARRFGASVHIYIDKDDNIENYYDNFAAINLPLEKIHPVKADLEDCFIQFMERTS